MEKTNDSLNDMLLAIFTCKNSLTTLQEKNWYHIPVKSAPGSFQTAKWMCFYQGRIFEDEAYRVQYYGEIESYEVVPYRDLFPDRIDSEKSDWLYYKIHLKELKRLSEPILSFRPRRLSFVPTTLEKFNSATQINDLFNESPLEDMLWQELKLWILKQNANGGFQSKSAIFILILQFSAMKGSLTLKLMAIPTMPKKIVFKMTMIATTN